MKKIISLSISIIVLCLAITSCMPPDKEAITNDDIELVQFNEPKEGQPIAIVDTDAGQIKMMLFDEYAPKAVENFINLVNDGFYDNKPFFAIDRSAGNIMSGAEDELGQNGILHNGEEEKIPPELHANLWHFPGAVSSYGKSYPTNPYVVPTDSRFFFVGSKKYSEYLAKELKKRNYPQKVLDKYEEVGGLIDFSGAYTVFGHVYEGLDIVDKILNDTKVESGTAKPLEEVLINKITISEYTKIN